MATAPDGNSSSRKGREGRPILTLMRIGAALQDSSKLPGAEHGNHSEKPSEKQDFETWLWAARNQWDISRRRGIARALLESRYRFEPLDLGFLRLMVNARSVTAADYMRLMSLTRAARERAQ